MRHTQGFHWVGLIMLGHNAGEREGVNMTDDLRLRETVRRKALWTLSHLVPGDPQAVTVLDVLDNIQDQKSIDLNITNPALP